MKWLPLIYERVREAEGQRDVFWRRHLPAALIIFALLSIPAVRTRTHVDPHLLAIPWAAHLLTYGWIVASGAWRRSPRLTSTLSAVVNLGATTAIPALSGDPGTSLWIAYVAYSLVSAVACGRSGLFLLALGLAPLVVGAVWHLSGVVPIADSIVAILLVDGMTVACYLLVGRKTDEHEWMREQLRQAEHTALLASERDRIARELHDSLGAGLTEVARWLQAVPAADPGDANGPLQRAAKRTQEALADLRACVSFFSSGTAPSADLIEGMIRSSAAGACDAAGAHLDLHVEGEPQGLSMLDARHLSLIVAEAANNAVRHGAARRVVAQVRLGQALRIVVEDDGGGFDPAALGGSGTGLRSIRTRGRALGCALRLERLAPSGMRLTLERGSGEVA